MKPTSKMAFSGYNMNIAIVQWGNEGGAPIMGRHLLRAIEELNCSVELIDLAPVCKFDYLHGLANNLCLYDARVDLVRTFFSSQRSFDLIIANCLKSAFAVEALKNSAKFVITYIHEGPTEIGALANGRFFKYKNLCDSDLILVASRITIHHFGKVDSSSELARKSQLLEPFSGYQLAAHSDLIRQLGFGDIRNSSLTPILGVCGTACKRKGFDRFYDLARELSDFKFVWAGSLRYIPAELGDDFPDNCSKLDNVSLLGHLDNVSDFYSSITCLLHICREDPSPLTSWEAASLGIKQIAFAQEIGNPHLIAKNSILIGGSYSQDRLSEALRAMQSNLIGGRHAVRRSCIRLYSDFAADVHHILLEVTASLT